MSYSRLGNSTTILKNYISHVVNSFCISFSSDDEGEPSSEEEESEEEEEESENDEDNAGEKEKLEESVSELNVSVDPLLQLNTNLSQLNTAEVIPVRYTLNKSCSKEILYIFYLPS